MYILNRTVRGGQQPQISAATPVATTSSGGDSSNIRKIMNNLEQALYGLEERIKFLEAENKNLKDINKKLQEELLSRSAVEAGEGLASGDVQIGKFDSQVEGGQHTTVEQPSEHPVDAGEPTTVVPTTDITTDVPSRIKRIKGRERRRKELSVDFTAGKRDKKGYYFRKRRRDSREQGSKESEASDSASGAIADVLMELKKEYNDPEGGVSAIIVPDEPSLDSSPGFIIEHRRDYPGRDKIPKDEASAIKFFISQPITKGAIWEDSTKRSDSPSISGEILRDFLFGGLTRDEVINVYFHILNTLDVKGVQTFTHPTIFCRTEVSMHILNRMLGIRPDEAISADFVRNVADGASSVRHFLEKITSQITPSTRFILIPVNSNWHWHLLIADLKESRFEAWNSLWSHRLATDAANLLAKWFASYFEQILQRRIVATNVIQHLDCQQQGSTEVDCGMYTCLFAERIVRGGSPDLLLYEEEPQCFREHMVSQILRDPCCVTSSSMLTSSM